MSVEPARHGEESLVKCNSHCESSVKRYVRDITIFGAYERTHTRSFQCIIGGDRGEEGVAHDTARY